MEWEGRKLNQRPQRCLLGFCSFALPPSRCLPVISHRLVVPFGGLVAVLPFSRRFRVARVPTLRVAARGDGWGCFRSAMSGRCSVSFHCHKLKPVGNEKYESDKKQRTHIIIIVINLPGAQTM